MNKLVSSNRSIHNNSMKNNEHLISGSINTAVSVRAGEHEYEEGKPEVVELAFEGYRSTYIQVIDLKTARSLMNQLKDILPPNYIEL
jgi:hypothetical protein